MYQQKKTAMRRRQTARLVLSFFSDLVAAKRAGTGEKAHFNPQSKLVIDTIELRAKLRG